jgi:maltose O-acetyltransferase
MRNKITILYSWIVRTGTILLPNTPVIMRFRGCLYSYGMKKCGKNLQVFSNAYINSLSELEIGDNVYIGPNTAIIGRQVFIGHNVLIGPNCVISAGNHTWKGDSFRFGKQEAIPVLINDGCWISGNCTITAGSVLPKQSILAAGAVLNKKFSEEKMIYAGVPAKLIKKITTT